VGRRTSGAQKPAQGKNFHGSEWVSTTTDAKRRRKFMKAGLSTRPFSEAHTKFDKLDDLIFQDGRDPIALLGATFHPAPSSRTRVET
jgi:hypothetical protein